MNANLRSSPSACAPRPTRIAFVSDAIHPYNRGGKERRLHELSRRLAGPEVEVHIYTMRWWDGPRTKQVDGVWLHAIARRRPLYRGSRRSTLQAVAFGLATLKLIFKRFDVLDVDHVPVFPLLTARLVCRVRRKPMVATWHEAWSRDYWRAYMGRAGFIGHSIDRFAVTLPDHIITESAATSSRLAELGRTKRLSTVPLGIDLARIDAAAASVSCSDIVYVGRLLPNKNVDVLLRALALVREQHPDLRCVIGGDGPERETLERITRDLGLVEHVTFTGSVSDDRLYGLLKASRLFVLPSEREGFGLVVLEANACGLPVVTTLHPDNAARLLIREGVNGWLAGSGVDALAATIVRALAEDDSMCPRRLIDEQRGRIDWSDVAREVEHLLLSHCGPRGRRRVDARVISPKGRSSATLEATRAEPQPARGGAYRPPMSAGARPAPGRWQ